MSRKTIYIPIWLDLLWTENTKIYGGAPTFTFQYGQIYYKLY